MFPRRNGVGCAGGEKENKAGDCREVWRERVYRFLADVKHDDLYVSSILKIFSRKPWSVLLTKTKEPKIVASSTKLPSDIDSKVGG